MPVKAFHSCQIMRANCVDPSVKDNSIFRRQVSRALVLLPTMLAFPAAVAGPGTSVDFARGIRPILVTDCDRYNGSKNREAELQLNRRSAAFGETASGERVIVPGDSEHSLFIRRLIDPDEDDLIPLDGEPLSFREIKLLRLWIDKGAVWPDRYATARHWAWESVERQVVPDPDSDMSAIAQFILWRLKAQSLEPRSRVGFS